MQSAWRIGIGVAVLVAAVGLFLLLQPGDDDAGGLASDTTTAPSETDTAPPETTSGPTTDGTTTEPEPANPTFRVDVPKGGPTEVPRLEVEQGERVTIVVTLKTHEDVHLHGYDLLLHTGPGLPPARFRFRADTTGSFELEMEQSHKPIAELRVRS